MIQINLALRIYSRPSLTCPISLGLSLCNFCLIGLHSSHGGKWYSMSLGSSPASLYKSMWRPLTNLWGNWLILPSLLWKELNQLGKIFSRSSSPIFASSIGLLMQDDGCFYFAILVSFGYLTYWDVITIFNHAMDKRIRLDCKMEV